MREKSILEQFFRGNYARTYCLAFGIVHDEEVSRDVVQDAFEQLFRQHPDLSEQEMRNCLYSIVRHKCADHFRHQAVHDRYSDYVMALSDRSATDDRLEHEEQTRQLQQAIGQLSPRTRQILNRHYLDNKKYREVADELSISESAVKKHVMQALRFFRGNCSAVASMGAL